MNFTRIFSLLSRAQVQFLNALLCGAAQRSRALSPFLLGMATKRFRRTPRRVLQPLCCWLFWGDEVKPTAPRQAASWKPGVCGARAVNLQAWRVPSLSCEPLPCDCGLCRSKAEGLGGLPPSHPLAFPPGTRVCGVGWLAAGSSAWGWGRKHRQGGQESEHLKKKGREKRERLKMRRLCCKHWAKSWAWGRRVRLGREVGWVLGLQAEVCSGGSWRGVAGGQFPLLLQFPVKLEMATSSGRQRCHEAVGW